MPSRPARRTPSSSRLVRGFTLIELLVVLVIIAAVAGLVIPNVSMFGRSTDMAVSAKTQADLASNAQMFFILQKRYPQGLDSLLDTTGALYASDATNADAQTRGLPISGADGTSLNAQLVASSLPANVTGVTEYLRSLTRSGFDWVYDHSLTVVNSNNSASVARGFVADYNGTVNPAPTPPVPVAEVTGAALLAKLVPQGLKVGERVIAFGLGGRTSAISKTLVNSPIYPGCDGKYYGRYILYFKVYASGERATLVGCSDSYGRTPDYTQQQFNESLPDGSRQG